MNQQPSIFFVLLTSHGGGALLVNIVDIMYVLPDGDGGAVYIRDGDALLCAEPPERVAALIKEAMLSNIAGLAEAAYRLAKEL